MSEVDEKRALLEQAMEAHGEMLTRLAMTYVKNREVAEDITQDVFVRAFEKIEDYRGDATYKTYLCKLTINRCHDHFRSWHYKNAQVIDWWERLVQPIRSLDEQVSSREEASDLGKAILSLPLRYREVIVLYYYQEFDVQEVAKLLGISDNTVKTRMKRARERLKKMLVEEGFDHDPTNQKSY